MQCKRCLVITLHLHVLSVLDTSSPCLRSNSRLAVYMALHISFTNTLVYMHKQSILYAAMETGLTQATKSPLNGVRCLHASKWWLIMAYPSCHIWASHNRDMSSSRLLGMECDVYMFQLFKHNTCEIISEYQCRQFACTVKGTDLTNKVGDHCFRLNLNLLLYFQT